ncbi:LOW QUALITY PROTEIN: hypothetical protein V2J09_023435 [Rumex salicifolius]
MWEEPPFRRPAGKDKLAVEGSACRMFPWLPAKFLSTFSSCFCLPLSAPFLVGLPWLPEVRPDCECDPDPLSSAACSLSATLRFALVARFLADAFIHLLASRRAVRRPLIARNGPLPLGFPISGIWFRRALGFDLGFGSGWTAINQVAVAATLVAYEF